MVDRYSFRILQHLSDRRYEPRRTPQLAQDLGIAGEELEPFRRAVEELIDEGQVVLGASDTLALPPPGREMVGSFRLNERGFGFIVPDLATQHGDLFVPAGNTGGAMTGDRVRARVIHEARRGGRSGRSPYVGRVVEILQRADRQYVGNLVEKAGRWFVEVDGRILHDPVRIRDPHAKNAHAGDKVVIELTEYPKSDKLPVGVITEVLGEKGQPDVETQAVMRAYGIADALPDEVLKEARSIVRGFDESSVPADREDLTQRFIFTIDPPDAKDFDDAICVDRLDPKKEPDGAAYELGVHIADVSSFVVAGGALDDEAYVRGNSVYLPRKVVPMLPEVLSNGICSLQEGVNRYSKSAFLRYDANGAVVGERFANTVTRSAKRLTYLEAQALIDGDLREARRHSRSESGYPRPLVEKLQLADELARLMRKRRLRDGMIVLGLPEVDLVFDESGRVIDAQPEDDAFTHTIIEMFMVEANEAAARLFNKLDLPMIRRVHPDPDAYDLRDLRQFARVAGYNIPMRPSRHELQSLLDSVRGKPAQHAVHLAVLKTLSKAEYSPQLIGHFALASEHYTHFTSPIRRYPDLVVHRALNAFLEAAATKAAVKSKKERSRLTQKLAQDPRCPDEPTLAQIGRHCSVTERNAEGAERDLRNYLVLELLSEYVAEVFAGTVTGVTGGGVFVEIDRYLVDGFVKTDDLPGGGAGQWRLNRATGALVAQRSGRTITIGDRFDVRIEKVNPAGRRLDLILIDPAKKTKKTLGSPKRRQPKGARSAHQSTMKLKRVKKKDRRRRR